MTSSTTPVDVAVAYLQAWARRDRTELAGYLADDIVFSGPLAQAAGAPAVLETIGAFAETVTELKIVAALGDDHQALVMYDIATVPFGTLRVAEHLTVRDGRIASSTLVFDTHEVRKATPVG